MFRPFALMLLGCLLLSIPACTSGDDNVPPATNEALTADAKKMILELVRTARQSPQAASAHAAGLHESLQPIDDPRLDEAKATAKELTELYSRSAPQSEIKAKLDELAKQAEAL